MRDDQNRRVPRERGVRVTVEMNDVGLKMLRDFQKPIARAIHVAPRVVHPFEFVATFKKLHVLQPRKFIALFA